jgi:hypothetical protein
LSSSSTLDGVTVTVRLHTSRLTLRRWEDADREPYAELASDAVVMQYLTPLGTREASDARQFVGASWPIAGHVRGSLHASGRDRLPSRPILLGAGSMVRLEPIDPARHTAALYHAGYASEAARMARYSHCDQNLARSVRGSAGGVEWAYSS